MKPRAAFRSILGTALPFLALAAIVLCRRVVGGVLFFLLVASAFATNRTVTNLNDSGPGSLRDTIAASNSGDTINFSVTGTITLTEPRYKIGFL